MKSPDVTLIELSTFSNTNKSRLSIDGSAVVVVGVTVVVGTTDVLDDGVIETEGDKTTLLEASVEKLNDAVLSADVICVESCSEFDTNCVCCAMLDMDKVCLTEDTYLLDIPFESIVFIKEL